MPHKQLNQSCNTVAAIAFVDETLRLLTAASPKSGSVWHLLWQLANKAQGRHFKAANLGNGSTVPATRIAGGAHPRKCMQPCHSRLDATPSCLLLRRFEGQQQVSEAEKVCCICGQDTERNSTGRCSHSKEAVVLRRGAAYTACSARLKADEVSLELLQIWLHRTFAWTGPGRYLLCRSESSISIDGWRGLCLAGSSLPLVRLLLHCRRFTPHVC